MTMITVNVAQAKAQLSELLHKVEQGETVRICRRNVPIVELKKVAGRMELKKLRPIGLSQGQFIIPDDAFAPMSEEELALWYDAPMYNPPEPEEEPKR